jgi:hypothetical protein
MQPSLSLERSVIRPEVVAATKTGVTTATRSSERTKTRKRRNATDAASTVTPRTTAVTLKGGKIMGNDRLPLASKILTARHQTRRVRLILLSPSLLPAANSQAPSHSSHSYLRYSMLPHLSLIPYTPSQFTQWMRSVPLVRLLSQTRISLHLIGSSTPELPVTSQETAISFPPTAHLLRGSTLSVRQTTKSSRRPEWEQFLYVSADERSCFCHGRASGRWADSHYHSSRSSKVVPP